MSRTDKEIGEYRYSLLKIFANPTLKRHMDWSSLDWRDAVYFLHRNEFLKLDSSLRIPEYSITQKGLDFLELVYIRPKD